jgi:hypothetical protein
MLLEALVSPPFPKGEVPQEYFSQVSGSKVNGLNPLSPHPEYG